MEHLKVSLILLLSCLIYSHDMLTVNNSACIGKGSQPDILHKSDPVQASEFEVPSDHSDHRDQNGSAQPTGIMKAVLQRQKSKPRVTPIDRSPELGQRNGSNRESKTKTYVLKETTTVIIARCKKDLDTKAHDVLTGTHNLDSLLDFIAAERLRSMPHRGSKWDKVLKWAETFAGEVDFFSNAIDCFAIHSQESARLIFGSCRVLLEVCLPQLFSPIWAISRDDMAYTG